MDILNKVMITPEIPKGFRDFLPDKLIHRQKIIETLRMCFESFGFQPLETPTLEYAKTLEGKYGQEGEKLIYKFEDRGGRKLALRYDLTIPLSRVIAMYPELIKPFKRYQIAPVWRADKPQKGRFREFWQCDIDIVGTKNILADAEIINIIYNSLKTLGLKNFTIRINHRQILNEIVKWCGITPEFSEEFLRSLDKLNQLKSLELVKKEMKDKGFSESSIGKFFTLLKNFNGKNEELFEFLKEKSSSITFAEAINELELLFKYIKNFKVSPKNFVFDISLARGLDYYTGIIHETTIMEHNIGSLTGGGRYDNLISLFTGTSIPATGASFGLERISAVMEELSMLGSIKTLTHVLITFLSPEILSTISDLASKLRSSGINTEIYLQNERLKKQLAYANNKGIPWVVIIGPEETAKGIFILRNMINGKQEEISQSNVEEIIRKVKESL